MKNIILSSAGIIGILVLSVFSVCIAFPFIDFLNGAITPSFSEDKVYFLVLGIDDAGEAGSDRTDVIAALCVDFKTGQMRIITIPRDLMVEVKNAGNTENIKINSVKKRFGLEKLKEIVESMLNINISRYAVVDYDIFKTLTDSVGKVRLFIDKKMYYEDNQQDLHIDFEPGFHELDGEELLKYIRFRDDALGDLGRMQRQKNAVIALMSKIRERIDLSFIQKSIPNIMKSMDTDIITNDLIQIISGFKDFGNILFVTYPYDILPSGNLATNSALFSGRVKEFKEGVSEQRQKTPEVVFLNGTDQSAYVFSIQIYNTFTGSGLNWITLGDATENKEVTRWLGDDSTIIMVSKDKEVEESIAGILKSRLAGKEFKVIYPVPGNGLREYYLLVDSLTGNGHFYSFPSDAFVYVK